MNKAKRISTFIILSMLFIASMCAFLFYGISGVDALSENGKPEIEMIDGASVRNDTENSGLRFSALINDGYFQSGTTLKDGFSAGMLIIDTDSYDESIALTHESKESNYAGRVLEVAAQVFDSNSDYSVDGQTVFNAVVTNIPDNAYGSGLSLTARAYVYDGTDYIYSEQVVSRCVAEVASIALASGESDENGILCGYVDAAAGDFTVDGDAGETVSLTLQVGENVAPVATPSYLTVALVSADEEKVSVADGKISAVAPSAEPVTVTATLGSKVKTINVTITPAPITEGLYIARLEGVGNGETFTELSDKEADGDYAGFYKVAYMTDIWGERIGIADGDMQGYQGVAALHFKYRTYDYYGFDVVFGAAVPDLTVWTGGYAIFIRGGVISAQGATAQPEDIYILDEQGNDITGQALQTGVRYTFKIRIQKDDTDNAAFGLGVPGAATDYFYIGNPYFLKNS